ncbi:hypothetical protein BGX34_009094 [Mortierella sp. NVP85]|nr:hypothetical protein BGX34_009094 [Mortierella sp. NVP85]
MRVESNFQAMDWDKLQEGFSWPLALGLNTMLVSVRMGYWLDDPLSGVPSILKSDRSYDTKSMSFLVAISFFNALWLFLSKKNYRMLHRDRNEKPLASNVRIVEVQQDETHWSFKYPGKLVHSLFSPLSKDREPHEDKLYAWEMAVWNPSIMSRNLFCWYSPAQVLIMLAMDTDNFHIFFPLSVVVAFQVHFLVSVYQSYVKDKQVLFAELHHEYNSKFVYPRIFVQKLDKGVSTETDMDDNDLQSFDQRTGTFEYISQRQPRKFQHLNVPASRYSTSASSNMNTNRRPTRSTASGTEDPVSEQSEEDGESEEHDEVEEFTDDSAQDYDSDDPGMDPDVDYDEEGEEPKVPHPTNSLHFGSDED